MSKFKKFKKHEVKGKTGEYTFFQIEGSPVLIVKTANESNKDYFNAILKRSKDNIGKILQNNISESMAEESRNMDREEYAEHVIVGWRNVVDDEGQEVEFSKEDCRDFLFALPDWIFDKLREFCTSNERIIASARNLELLAKNSQTDSSGN